MSGRASPMAQQSEQDRHGEADNAVGRSEASIQAQDIAAVMAPEMIQHVLAALTQERQTHHAALQQVLAAEKQYADLLKCACCLEIELDGAALLLLDD